MPQINSRLWDILRKSSGLLEDGDASSIFAPIGLRVPVPNGKACQLKYLSEMAEMLQVVGAPEPWLRPEKCVPLVGCPATLRSSAPEAVAPKLDIQHSVQKAVNELRRVLSAHIQFVEYELGEDLAALIAISETNSGAISTNQTIIKLGKRTRKAM